MDMMKIGVFLQNLRKDKNFTQQELADCFHVSSKTVSKWECGKALPEIPLLKEISEFYSVSVDEILNGERNIEGAMGNTMRKEEMQKAYQKKKKMWSIFIYVSFFVLNFTLKVFRRNNIGFFAKAFKVVKNLVVRTIKSIEVLFFIYIRWAMNIMMLVYSFAFFC